MSTAVAPAAARPASAPALESVDVLYIAGAPRSGSTVLALLLERIPGVFCAGEMRFVWRQLALPGRCGCGQALAACEVWSSALQRAGFSKTDTNLQPLVRAARGHSHLRALIQCVLSQLTGRIPKRFRLHLEQTARLYPTLAAEQRAHTIVDSSKSPSYALVLASVPSIRLRVIHLIRDPRAVAYSFIRERGSDLSRSRRVGLALRQAAKWTAWNAACELLRRRAVTYVRLHYETLADHPAATVRWATSRPAAHEETHESLALPTVNHTAFGNGLRFNQGEAPIRRDDAWLQEMGRLEQLAVLAVTWPLLRRYTRPREAA